MKRILLLPFVILVYNYSYSQGCTVTASAPRDTIVCGESILLTAFGRGQGIALLSENFNTGSFGSGWQSTPQAMWNNPCSPNGVDGTTHIWLGNSSPVPRALTTASFNLSSCANAGVTICFDMLFATQGNSAPCEGPDEPNEGVYLQYSINNGTTWITINYFDPNGGNDPQFVNWNNWCFPVPAIALTSNTRFRWFQDADSGADYDHWGIDNVVIYCNDPTYNVVWQHDGHNSGPTGGTNPTPVAPRTTTSYVVVMSNGTTTCIDTVRVVVRNPTLIVNAGNDTTVCTGQCAQLNATAKVLVSPAKIVTYSNNEITPITTGFGQVSNININVTGLNMNNVLPNSITQVCISNVFFFGTSIFPPAQIDISDLILTLVCPDGTSIILVPANVTNGGSNPLTGGYNNTCFIPAGPNIATGTSPYTGSWAPNQPFNNLVGCSANGLWTLSVTMNTSLGFGSGTFSGWSITFDDPEISYTGNFNWNPTTNMTGANTLIPRVCPPLGTHTYTITVSDTANCVTQSDAVNVTVQPCCGLNASVNITQPACAQSNGAINVTPQPSGTYTYLWNDNNTSQNRTALAAGTYSVTITDTNDPTCTFDTTITLNSNSNLVVSFTNPVNPTCAGNDGSITVGLSGGTAPYQVTIDTGGTPFTITVPFPISQTIGNLPAGSISASVTDAQGCVASANATLIAPTNCCTFTVSAAFTQPGCAQSNGSITLTNANGSGNYSYSWGGGLGATNSVSNLSVGTYQVTITDNAYPNCFIDTTFSLSNPNAPTLDNVQVTAETCPGTNDGAITVTASGGTGQLTINWSNGDNSFTISNLSSDNYSFTITDASGCVTPGNATLTAGNGCCTLETDVIVTPPTCGLNNAVVTVNELTAGVLPYTYSLNGLNFQSQNTFSNVPSGAYNVITLDANLCSDTVTITVPLSSNSLLVSIAISNITCFGANNGGLTPSPTGGNAPYSFSWSNGSTAPTLANLAPGNYSVTVTDQSGCSGSGVESLTQPTPLAVSLGNDTTLCEGSAVLISAPGGFSTYQWSSGETNQFVSPATSGTYTVTVTDANGCTASDNVSVSFVPTPVIDLGPDKIVYEGERTGLFVNFPNGNNGSGVFDWQPTDGLSCNTCEVPVALATDTITYTLTYTDQFGCFAIDDITLFVLPIDELFFPNAFTPNGDGNNDIYFPYGSGVKQINWQIFNRWGEKVFESNSLFYGWNGIYKGQPAPQGVYVYQAEVVMMNDKERKFKGSLTLIR